MQVPTAAAITKHENLQFEKGDLVADRYLIEQKIGSGGMGVVFRAHDTLVNEVVALKFMNPRLLLDIS